MFWVNGTHLDSIKFVFKLLQIKLSLCLVLFQNIDIGNPSSSLLQNVFNLYFHILLDSTFGLIIAVSKKKYP